MWLVFLKRKLRLLASTAVNVAAAWIIGLGLMIAGMVYAIVVTFYSLKNLLFPVRRPNIELPK
jgi:hypothetical protein